MARKPSAEKAKKTTKNPHGPRVIDDNFVAPKRRKKAEEPKPMTLAEALEESGQTLEELTAAPAEAEKPTRPAGNSNLANTIRARRKSYQVMLHPNGKKTQNTGDEIAVLLLNIPLAALKDFSGLRFDGRRYDTLNPGHARMCIGNRIRAAVKNGDNGVMEWLHSQQPKIEDAEEEYNKVYEEE